MKTRNKKPAIKFLLGLAIIVLAVLVLPFFVQAATVDTGLQYAAGTGLTTQDIRVTIAKIIRVFLGLLGIIALVLIIYGGFYWMLAGGSPEKVEKAKKILINGVIGLVIIISAFAITQFILSKLMGATIGEPPNKPCSDSNAGEVQGCWVCQPPSWVYDATLCGGGATVFRINNIQPPEDSVSIRNTVVRIYFNMPIQEESLEAGDIKIEKLGTIDETTNEVKETYPTPQEISGSLMPKEGNPTIVEFRPEAICPGDEDKEFKHKCFDAWGWYKVTVAPGSIISQTKKTLQCGGVNNTCERKFKTNAVIDTMPPVVNITSFEPSQGKYIPAEYPVTVNISATDDQPNGVSGVELYIDNKLPDDATMSEAPYVYTWQTPSEIGSEHNLFARAMDQDENEGVSPTRTVKLRAWHCFNGVKDETETDIDCGGADCGACNGANCDLADEDPASCKEPTNDICKSDYCNPSTCLCECYPEIDKIEPAQGKAGNLITISGFCFGATSGQVLFKSASGEILGVDPKNLNSECDNGYWKDNQIIIGIPEGAVNGPIKVADNLNRVEATNDSRGPALADFIIGGGDYPGICRLSPTSGSVASPFDVVGINYGDGQGSGKVTFGNKYEGTVKNWSDQKISALVGSVTNGLTSVRVRREASISNPADFTVISSPETNPIIDDLDPDNGQPGQYVTVFGRNFGAEQGRILFYGYQADCTTPLEGTDLKQIVLDASFDFPAQCEGKNWRDKYIIMKVPTGVENGKCYQIAVVRNKDGIESNKSQFKGSNAKITPGICALDPDNGPVGTDVNIFGNKFGGSGQVNFWQDQVASTKIWGDMGIATVVPNLAKTGPVQVVKASGDKSNRVQFRVADCRDDGEENKCEVGETCCGDGVCSTDCATPPTSCQYLWSFSTDLMPIVPAVLERCISGVSCDKQNLPSPSPWSEWDAYGGKACINSTINAVFNTQILSTALSDPESVKVEQCASNSDDSVGCLDPVRINGILEIKDDDGSTEDSKTAITFTAKNSDGTSANLIKNTWYKVTFKAGCGSGVDKKGVWSAGAGTSNQGSAPMPNDYSWMFQVRDSDSPCDIGCVSVLPSPFTAQTLGLLKKLEGSEERDVYHTANPKAKDNACVLLRADDYDWEWKSDDEEKATISNNKKADGKGFYRQQATTIAETAGNKFVKITAEEQIGHASGDAELYIHFKEPEILYRWPNCDHACLESMIGVAFNTEMLNKNSDGYESFPEAKKANAVDNINNVKLYFCGNDGACAAPTYSVSLNNPIYTDDSGAGTPAHKLEFSPANGYNNGKLLPGVYYRVLVMGNVTNLSDVPLNKKGLGAPYGFDSEFNPNQGTLACKYACSNASNIVCSTDADCQNFGQCENGTCKKNPAQVCDNNSDCLVPTGKCVISSGAPCCGNGLKEAGEDCDDGNINNNDSCPSNCDTKNIDSYSWVFKTKSDESPCSINRVEVVPNQSILNWIGAKQPYFSCTYGSPDECSPFGQSLNPYAYNWNWWSDDIGVASVSLVDGCGNGEIQQGENCDDVNIINGDGCSSNCLNEGSISIIAGSICGDGKVEKGESCDDGNTIDSDGCNSNCLNEGNENYNKAVCGDGIIEGNEACDIYGNLTDNNGDGCQSDCTHEGSISGMSVCGNGVVEFGEECEVCGATRNIITSGSCADAVKPISTDLCSDKCLLKSGHPGYKSGSDVFNGKVLTILNTVVCGDGIVETGEDCDDGKQCSNNKGISCENDSDCVAVGGGICATQSGDGCSSSCLSEGSNWNQLDDLVDPFQIATALGLGASPEVGKISATTKIWAAALDPDKDNPLAKNNGDLTVMCGYSSANPCPVNICQAGRCTLTNDISCTSDTDCKLDFGSDTCCYPIPKIIKTVPIDGMTGICRNTVIQAIFDRPMNIDSFVGKVAVVGDYSSVGSCPDGTATFVVMDDSSGAGGVFTRWLARVYGFIVNFVSHLFGQEARADGSIYCSVPGTASGYNTIKDGKESGIMDFRLSRPLDAHIRYGVIIKTGVRDAKGVRWVEPIGWDAAPWHFVTGADICQLTTVEVRVQEEIEPPYSEQYVYYNINQNQKFKVAFVSGGNGDIQPIDGTYNWDTNLYTNNPVVSQPAPSVCGSFHDNSSVCDSIFVKSEAKGKAQLTAGARIIDDKIFSPSTMGQYYVGSIDLIVFPCNNPWPNPNGPYYDPISSDDISGSSGPVWKDTDSNFSFFYCRDYGQEGDFSDDLPRLKSMEVPAPATNPGVYRLFTLDRTDDPDLVPYNWHYVCNNNHSIGCNVGDESVCGVGVCSDVVYNTKTSQTNDFSDDRIIVSVERNPEHLSPLKWFKEKFPTAGEPSEFNVSGVGVDGYKAVRDGNTIYVAAANKTALGYYYTNIYIFSYNDGANAATSNIFNQIIANASFNINSKIVTDENLCHETSGNILDVDLKSAGVQQLGCSSDIGCFVCSGADDRGKACSSDDDCASGEYCMISNYCRSGKSKLRRDVVRAADLNDLSQILTDYFYAKGSYPDLKAGTYKPGETYSVWPSWNATLGNALGVALPVDPLNQFIGCSAPYNKLTCWNDQDQSLMTPSPLSHYYNYEYFYDAIKKSSTAEFGTHYELDGIDWSGSSLINGDSDGDGVLDESDNCSSIRNGYVNICAKVCSNNKLKTCSTDADCGAGSCVFNNNGSCCPNSNPQNCCIYFNPDLKEGDAGYADMMSQVNTYCGQKNSDGDELGNACDILCMNDKFNDPDGDGICGRKDRCWSVYDPTNLDSNNNCPLIEWFSEDPKCGDACESIDSGNLCKLSNPDCCQSDDPDYCQKKCDAILGADWNYLRGGSLSCCGDDDKEGKGLSYQAVENRCDGIDNDCDGTIDEGCDDDHDGYCDATMHFPVLGSYQCSGSPNCCLAADPTIDANRDCDDTDKDIHPGAMENCGDNKDNDCDGKVDEIESGVAPIKYLTFGDDKSPDISVGASEKTKVNFDMECSAYGKISLNFVREASKVPTAIVFVTDVSYSMQGKVASLKAALWKTITDIFDNSDNVLIALVSFGSQAEEIQKTSFKRFYQKADLQDEILSYQAHSSYGTASRSAFEVAERMLNDNNLPSSKMIVFMSDGDPEPDPYQNPMEKYKTGDKIYTDGLTPLNCKGNGTSGPLAACDQIPDNWIGHDIIDVVKDDLKAKIFTGAFSVNSDALENMCIWSSDFKLGMIDCINQAAGYYHTDSENLSYLYSMLSDRVVSMPTDLEVKIYDPAVQTDGNGLTIYSDETACSDGIDNDGDGKIDGDDSVCQEDNNVRGEYDPTTKYCTVIENLTCGNLLTWVLCLASGGTCERVKENEQIVINPNDFPDAFQCHDYPQSKELQVYFSHAPWVEDLIKDGAITDLPPGGIHFYGAGAQQMPEAQRSNILYCPLYQ